MSEDQDNAGEVVAATVRVALTAAGQLAEQAARRREAALRDAERDSAAQVATLQAQVAAERQLARHSVRDVLQRGDRASVEEFVQAWQQIRSWDDPVAAADRDRLRGVIRERFGVDADSLPGRGDPLVPLARTRERDIPTAATLMATESAGQREDAQRRGVGAADRVTALAAPLEDAGIDADVAQARALAAQSHPTSPTLAAQPPAGAARVHRRAGKRQTGVEVQSPGR